MSVLLNLHSVSTAQPWCVHVASLNDCRLSRGGSAGFGDAAAAAPPDQVAQVAQAMAQNPGARGMDLAAKMMEKMGWKSGLGLGRNKQVGIASVPNALGTVSQLCASTDIYSTEAHCSRLLIPEVPRKDLRHAENSTHLLCCATCAGKVSQVMGTRDWQYMRVASLIIMQSPVCMCLQLLLVNGICIADHDLLCHMHHAMSVGAQLLATCIINHWSVHHKL